MIVFGFISTFVILPSAHNFDIVFNSKKRNLKESTTIKRANSAKLQCNRILLNGRKILDLAKSSSKTFIVRLWRPHFWPLENGTLDKQKSEEDFGEEEEISTCCAFLFDGQNK